MKVMLDAGPILRMIEDRGGLECALRRQTTPRQRDQLHQNLKRMVERGDVELHTADRMCIQHFGILPELLYGRDWFQGVPDDVTLRATPRPAPGATNGQVIYLLECSCGWEHTEPGNSKVARRLVADHLRSAHNICGRDLPGAVEWCRASDDSASAESVAGSERAKRVSPPSEETAQAA